MNLNRIVNRQSVNKVSICYGRFISPHLSNGYRDVSTVSVCAPASSNFDASQLPQNRHCTIFSSYLHSASASQPDLKPQFSSSAPKLDSDDSGGDGTTNEFLSRFAWIMRKKLSEAYPECDKPTVDGMLLVIVDKVVYEMEKGNLDQMLGSDISSEEFSEDLWRTVWEVSNSVVEDMEKERKKEKMKHFLQDEEVKEMCRFAGEIGLQGDMLRELRFKWAREKMEEADFYEGLKRLREEEEQQQEERGQEKAEAEGETTTGEETLVTEEGEEAKVVDLPKRHGKIKYKIYGLDLSDSKWGQVADKIHKAGEAIWPQEPKPISGKCKLVAEKILSLKMEDDPSSLLAEYKELQEPRKVDWIALLDQLKEQNSNLHLKIAEHLLSETSFQANIRDYSNLIAAHAEENCVEDAERILQKMKDNSILPDILTAKTLALMYSKAGDMDKARQAFETYKSHGFKPDTKVCNSMIMAYVKAGRPDLGEQLLLRDMEITEIVTEEIIMALLASFSKLGDAAGAGRISSTMTTLAGIKDTLESYTLLIEAYARVGDVKKARNNFDHMMKTGMKPDDRCTASIIAAYEKKNLLDEALELLLKLEGDVGFELGVATYTVMIDWLGKMGLIDEVEQLLGKIANLGEAYPLKIQVILCDMYARAKMEKKALQALGVLEAKKEQLGANDFERVIRGLLDGEFGEEAQRIEKMMLAQGHTQSEDLKIALATKVALKFNRTFRRT
ncbi:unnamed protein product [Linum tenue]|uniref:Pentatricopeptide repeat-containing protein-mitochondrial domain-containing protein n=1 Tax=Linum tenue TaxID=586396 RepID=A0AAV0LQT5_9ROSI|nr:unnamed protein product [Linum tenue]